MALQSLCPGAYATTKEQDLSDMRQRVSNMRLLLVSQRGCEIWCCCFDAIVAKRSDLYYMGSAFTRTCHSGSTAGMSNAMAIPRYIRPVPPAAFRKQLCLRDARASRRVSQLLFANSCVCAPRARRAELVFASHKKTHVFT